MSSKFATGKHAIAICQRSGLQFPYSEMIKEPGTGLWIHYSESDGMYNRVDHPQLHIKGVADRIGLRNPMPDDKEPVTVNFLTTDTGDFITVTEMFGQQSRIEVSTYDIN